MTDIRTAMEECAEWLTPLVNRPVTCDPRSVVATPCVLIEPPTLDLSDGQTYCGQIKATLNVIVVGMPGGWAELAGLSSLLVDVFGAFNDSDRYYPTSAEPVGYVPLNSAGQADPCQAYRVSVEVYI